MEKIWAVVPAAGSGSRMGIRDSAGNMVKKQFIELAGKPILVYTLEALSKVPAIQGILLVTGKEDISLCENLVEQYGLDKVQRIIPGGTRRQDSVFLGLQALSGDTDLVVIHDGARPFVTVAEVEATIQAARKYGGAVLGVPVTDTIKVVDSFGTIETTPERSRLYSANTPQTFRYPDILEGHRRAAMLGDFRCTDDSQIVEKYMDTPVHLVLGSYENIKITTPGDLTRAEGILNRRKQENEA